MLVYGVGNHLHDMLTWHPDLSDRIERIFDKNPGKIGKRLPACGKIIESRDALRDLPSGTMIAIAAIRYYAEISKEIRALNPGLRCINIDSAYDMSEQSLKNNQAKVSVTQKSDNTQEVLCLRGQAATWRWQRDCLLSGAQKRHVFWGTKGVRASYLSREFIPLMGKSDIFIEEDVSLCGKMLYGMPICLPEVLKDITEQFQIIVLSEDYDRVRNYLAGYGYVENIDFLEGRRLLGKDENGLLHNEGLVGEHSVEPDELVFAAQSEMPRLTEDDVITVYQEILARRPESEQVIADHIRNCASIEILRKVVLESDEYRGLQAKKKQSGKWRCHTEDARIASIAARLQSVSKSASVPKKWCWLDLEKKLHRAALTDGDNANSYTPASGKELIE